MNRPIILVVEDEVLLRFVVADILRSEGFQVVEAATADEALAYLNARNPASLVFSDVRMEGSSIDGVELAAVIRRDFAGLPVILASGHLTPDMAGPDVPLLQKPYALARLIADIRAALPPEPKSETENLPKT